MNYGTPIDFNVRELREGFVAAMEARGIPLQPWQVKAVAEGRAGQVGIDAAQRAAQEQADHNKRMAAENAARFTAETTEVVSKPSPETVAAVRASKSKEGNK